MQRKQTIGLGILLIALGAWALLSALEVPWARLNQLWPVILILLGGMSLYGALARHPRDSGGVWFGTVTVLCGGFFLAITAGPFEWRDLNHLWPVFPAVMGLAWLAAWVVNVREVSNMVMGLIGLGIGALGFAYTMGRIGAERAGQISQWWPLILILIGLGLIAQFLAQRR